LSQNHVHVQASESDLLSSRQGDALLSMDDALLICITGHS